VDKLAQQECRQRSDDNSKTLSEYAAERIAHVEVISFRVLVVGVEPKACCRKFDGEEDHQKRICNERGSEIADPLYTRPAEIFVDQVARDEYHRPNKGARG